MTSLIISLKSVLKQFEQWLLMLTLALILWFIVDQANWTVAVAAHYSNECNDGRFPKPNSSGCQSHWHFHWFIINGYYNVEITFPLPLKAMVFGYHRLVFVKIGFIMFYFIYFRSDRCEHHFDTWPFMTNAIIMYYK